MKVSGTITNESGFSVLEAMIAMAVLAAAFLPLLELQGKMLDTVGRLEQVDIRTHAMQESLKTIQTTNLSQQTSGELLARKFKIYWRTSQALPTRIVRLESGFPSRYEISIFDVFIKIEYKSGRIDEFSTKGLGWKERKDYIEVFQ